MANETVVGELSINLKMKLDGLEKGLDTAKKRLQEIEKQNEQVKNSNKQLDANFFAVSASIVASLVKIKSAIDDGVNKYNTYVNSMTALEKTARATNNSIENVKNTIEDVNKLKLMDDSDVTAATKNLLTYGFTVEQTADILKVLQDAAVGNRQANYTLSEAVRVTTEGIRMENSVLSDAAGVQKNISKMYEDYATKIGKTTDSLTQAEKVQAVYNGIMNEAAMFTGSAAEMANGYQGQQAQLNAVNLELSRTLGEAMIPSLTQYSSLQLSITKGLAEFITNNKGATSGIITFTTTLLAAVVALTTAKKAYNAYTIAAKTADMTTKAFTASLMTNPITLIAVAIAAVVAGLSIYNTKMQESIELMEEKTQKSKDLTEALKNFEKNNYTYTDSEKTIVENERNEAQEIVNIHEEKKNKIEDIENQIRDVRNSNKFEFEKRGDINTLTMQLNEAREEMRKFEEENFSAGQTIDFYQKKVDTLTQSLEWNDAKQQYLTKTNIKSQREQLISIAQTKADIDGKKELLKVLKDGKKGTEQYENAKSQLVKVYPELAKVNENTISSTEAAIEAEERAAQSEWALTQATIMNSIAELTAMQANDTLVQNIAYATQQKVEDVRASIEAATQSLVELSKMSIEDFQGSVTSNYTPKKVSSGGGSYSNKRLDNYKKEIEHKKAMDQISLSEEIKMYEKALRSYAKTTDEKRELREKIYELNKEMAQKEKEILDQQTEDYEIYIEEQKILRGAAYSTDEQTKDYDKIIKMHKSYLDQIMKDERLSLEERKELYREELEIIRDYEKQKYELRVEQIDNTVSQLTDAITNKLEDMQSKEKEMIDKNLEMIEEWKNARIDAINQEYDARIEAIEKELEALDKAEKQKSRDEEDEEFNSKKQRLEDLIAYEHDETTKANYQKELNKLIEEHEKTLNQRVLEDKKEALNEQKEMLKDEQQAKIEAIEKETAKRKEEYEKQLQMMEEYYEEQMNKAQETAQMMLLNVEQNQNEILELLQTYGDHYAITGQTFGEKLGQSFADTAMQKIQNAISQMQKTIDAAIASNIARLQASAKAATSSGSNTTNKTVNVTQHNTFTSYTDSPSRALKKQETINRNLANSISRVF